MIRPLLVVAILFTAAPCTAGTARAATPGAPVLCDLAAAHGTPARAWCLAQLLRACAPNVHPQTLAAIVDVESGAWPWTLHDNTTSRAYFGKSAQTAYATALLWLRRGDSVDIGLGQVNSGNLPGLGLSLSDALSPCANLGAADRILSNAWEDAVDHFGRLATYAPSDVLLYAISEYNSGSLFAAPNYVRTVVAATRDPLVMDTVAYAGGAIAARAHPGRAIATHVRPTPRPRILVRLTFQEQTP